MASLMSPEYSTFEVLHMAMSTLKASTFVISRICASSFKLSAFVLLPRAPNLHHQDRKQRGNHGA